MNPSVQKIRINKMDKIQFFLEGKNMNIQIGFLTFIDKCMKGYDLVMVQNEMRVKMTVKKFILSLFLPNQFHEITNSYQKTDYIYSADFPDLSILQYQMPRISNSHYQMIESMFHSYLYESKIKDLWMNSNHLSIEDHNHFMRFLLAVSSLQRLHYQVIDTIAERYFQYCDNLYMKYNCVKNIKLPIGFYDDIFPYHDILEYFYIPTQNITCISLQDIEDEITYIHLDTNHFVPISNTLSSMHHDFHHIEEEKEEYVPLWTEEDIQKMENKKKEIVEKIEKLKYYFLLIVLNPQTQKIFCDKITELQKFYFDNLHNCNISNIENDVKKIIIENVYSC